MKLHRPVPSLIQVSLGSQPWRAVSAGVTESSEFQVGRLRVQTMAKAATQLAMSPLGSLARVRGPMNVDAGVDEERLNRVATPHAGVRWTARLNRVRSRRRLASRIAVNSELRRPERTRRLLHGSRPWRSIYIRWPGCCKESIESVATDSGRRGRKVRYLTGSPRHAGGDELITRLHGRNARLRRLYKAGPWRLPGYGNSSSLEVEEAVVERR